MKKLAAVLAISAALFMTGGCGSSGGSSNDGGWYFPPVGPVTPENTGILVTKGGENTAYVEADATSAVFKFRLNEKWTVNEALRGADNSLVKFTPDSGNGNDNIVTASFPVNDGNTERIYDIPIYSGSNGRQISNVKIVQKMTPKEKAWLFVTYLAADNNLTRYQLDNLKDMESVGSDENTHMVAFVDIGEGTYLKDTEWEGKLDWKDARAFYITKSDNTEEKSINSELIKDYGKVDSGSPSTLEEFLTATMKNYPSKHVVLVMNNHGGAYTGAMTDYENNSIISCSQIKTAILNAEAAAGKKIDVIGFDACLMADFENLYELRNTADYFCVSEENIGGIGWDYNSLFEMANNPILYDEFMNSNNKEAGSESKVNPMLSAMKQIQNMETSKIAAEVTPKEFGSMSVVAAAKNYMAIKHFACLKSSGFEQSKKAIDDLAKTIIAECNGNDSLAAETKNLLTKIPDGSEDNVEYGRAGGYCLYDAITMMRSLAANSSNENIKKAAALAELNIQESDVLVLFTNTGFIPYEGFQEYNHSIAFSLLMKYDYFPAIEYAYMDNEFAKTTSWVQMLRTIGTVN